MPEFLLSVHHDYTRPLGPAGVDPEALYRAVDDLNRSLQDAGAWVHAGGLMPPDSATVVDSSGETLTITGGARTPGAFHMGGFWVIEVGDHETAQTWAVQASRAVHAPVEVRPLQG